MHSFQPRIINLQTRPSDKKIIIYPDAFWDEGFSGSGSLLVIEDKEPKHSAEFTPDLQADFQQRQTYIHPAELLAHVGGTVSNLQHMKGKKAFAFNNVSVVAALVTSASSRWDTRLIVTTIRA